MTRLVRPALFSILLAISAGAQPVRTGADVLISSRMDLLKDKRIGLVVNHSALLSDGRHLVDALAANPNVHLVALFGPEHGIRGDTTGSVSDATDAKTGIPVFSLYGATVKPTPKMLSGIDLIVFDIQDVGARFYTYISTLGHVLSAAAEQNIPVIVLDRPNPITGLRIEGPVAESSLRSFVAYAPIPTVHGMTIGELAEMYNGEGWLENTVRATLTVVDMEGWKRYMWFDQTGQRWVKPSPNLLTLDGAIAYPGTCLFEGTSIAEGRGTERPFQIIGAPWIDGRRAAAALSALNLPGVRFDALVFTPVWQSFNVRAPKFADTVCQGVSLTITDRESFQPVLTGVALLRELRNHDPAKFRFRQPGFDRLAGVRSLAAMLEEGKTTDKIVETWAKDLEAFRLIRAKYLRY